MLDKLSRWIREGPAASALPWRLRGPLERLTIEHAYPAVPGPLRWIVRTGHAEATLLFGGDLALHRWQAGTDPRPAFDGLDALIDSAHGFILNLESQLTGRETPAGIIGSSLRADPSALSVLSRLRITAVSCANNHCVDFGTEGLAESVERVESAGIAVIGIRGAGGDGGRVIEVQGLRLGLLAFADDWRVLAASRAAVGPSPHDPEVVRDRITAMRQVADVVIVQLHWGYEWSMYPLRSQRDLARQYADAGANLVLCHHAHVPMAVETRGANLIAHGLGNFYFGAPRDEGHPFSNASFLLRAGVSREGVVEAEALPIRTTTEDRVEPAAGRPGDLVRRALARLSSRLDDDRYHNEVESSLLAQQGCALFLDLARRLGEGDSRGVEERARYLGAPRQLLLTASLASRGVLPREVAGILEQVRTAGGPLIATPLAREILALRPTVQEYQHALRQKGRIP